MLLYRINIGNQNRIRFQNHLETINAILGGIAPVNVGMQFAFEIFIFDVIEEGNLRVEEEEIIIIDDPPDYEAPPEYSDIVKNQRSSSPPPTSPSPSYSKGKSSDKWFQWLNVKRNFKNFKQDANIEGRLVVSYSDSSLEKCVSFDVGNKWEGDCVMRRSQSIDSFMT